MHPPIADTDAGIVLLVSRDGRIESNEYRAPVLSPSQKGLTLGEGQSRSRRHRIIRPPTFSLGLVIRGLRTLGDYSELLYTLSAHRLRVRYKQSLLGITWAVFQPLALMLIYTLVFSRIAKIPSGQLPYPLFAFGALLPWTFFATAVSNATNGLVSNSQLVTKVYFPREILPLSYVIAAVVDLLVAASLLALLMMYYELTPTIHALWALPILIVLTMIAIALSLLLSATQVRFRDIGVAMPLLMQLWLFATPVVYSLDQVPASIRPYYVLNPLVGVIEGFRVSVLVGSKPDLHSLGISTTIAVVLLPISYLYFKHVESTVADVI